MAERMSTGRRQPSSCLFELFGGFLKASGGLGKLSGVIFLFVYLCFLNNHSSVRAFAPSGLCLLQ